MPSASKRQERRNNRRLPRIEKLFVQTAAEPVGNGARRTFPGSTTDISVDGMQICTAADVEEGCPVEIWIEAPGGWHGKLLMPGIVRWHDTISDGAAYLIGVQLRPLASRDRTIWGDLVRALAPSSAADARC
jgi:hypothetical protein